MGETTKPTIALALMVKNEARIVQRLLDSIKPYIDKWCVLDTGSTDGTQDVILKSLAEIPGVLEEEPFVDFAISRNRLLEEARKQECDYLLLMDADHVLHVEAGALDNLTADSYLIELTGALAYYMPYLVKTSVPFRYISPTHEYLTADGGFSQEKLPGVWLDHYGDGGTRHEKFERDLALLNKSFEEDPNNVRTVFYLANTYRDMGEHDKALELYRRHTTLNWVWDEEKFYSLLHIAEITRSTDDYLTALSFRPTRKEPYHRLCRKMNEEGKHKAAYMFGAAGIALPQSQDILFVEDTVEKYEMLFEYAIAAWWEGFHEAAGAIWRSLLDQTLPDHYRASIENNLKLCS